MPGSVLPRLFPALLLLVGLATALGARPEAAAPEQAQAQEAPGTVTAGSAPEPDQGPEPALILELIDSALIAGTWQSVFPDSAQPDGEYQILIPSEPALSGGVFLLRNGTEAGRIDRAAWDSLAALSRKGAKAGWASSQEGAESRDVDLLWTTLKFDRASLFRWAAWPAGLSAGMGSAVSTVQSSKPQFQRDVEFAWDQKVFGAFLLGGAVHRTQFGGGLTRLAENVADSVKGVFRATGREFWSEADWWWSISAGVPGIKYTLSLADQPLPRYFWMETRASAAIREHRSGRLVNQWTGSKLGREGNLAHTLDARLGVLRYQFHWDMDAYTMPIQTFSLNDMPSPFGSWGIGLISASDLLATRLWMDIPDASITLPHPEAYPSVFRVAFLHIDLAYRNLRSFSLGISVRVKVDNPILNRPGA